MAIEIFELENERNVPCQDEVEQLDVKKHISQLVLDLRGIVVKDEKSYRTMTSHYKCAREWKNIVEAKRKEMVEPFRKEISAINDKAKGLTDPLDEAIEIANHHATLYLRHLQDLKRAEDEKLRKAAALFDAEEDLYIPHLETKIRSEDVTITTKTEKQFRVVDISKVPRKYLTIDEEAIMQDIKLGVGEIPGLEISETTTTRLRVK